MGFRIKNQESRIKTEDR